MSNLQAVIDSNVAVYAVTGMELSAPAAALLESLRAKQTSLYAPRLWVYEVTSSIHKYLHVKYLTLAEAERALEIALAFDINLIDKTPGLCQSAFQWATRLGQMAAYDGFYLAVAETLKVPLWTGDKRLFNAAKGLDLDWVHWMGDLE